MSDPKASKFAFDIRKEAINDKPEEILNAMENTFKTLQSQSQVDQSTISRRRYNNSTYKSDEHEMIARTDWSHEKVSAIVSIQLISLYSRRSSDSQSYRNPTMIVDSVVSIAPTITTTYPGRKYILYDCA